MMNEFLIYGKNCWIGVFNTTDSSIKIENYLKWVNQNCESIPILVRILNFIV